MIKVRLGIIITLINLYKRIFIRVRLALQRCSAACAIAGRTTRWIINCQSGQTMNKVFCYHRRLVRSTFPMQTQ